MTAFCPRCGDEIAEDQVIYLEDVTYCRDHAKTTTIYQHVMWRDAPGELG